MYYLYDFPVGKDVNVYFSTNKVDGEAITAAISASDIKIYKDGADSGITVDADELSLDFEGAGNHKIKLDVSDHPTIYTSGSDFALILTTGTVDGKTVRAPLVQFSIENGLAGSVLFKKAAKLLVNKAIQNKATGAVEYYDDDGETVILTHTPDDGESAITRTPS